MDALHKIATITILVAEIGDCDEIQLTLDGFIETLSKLKNINPTNIPSIILTPSQLECELGEAYRQGKKDSREDFEYELMVCENKTDDETKQCSECGISKEDINFPLCEFCDQQRLDWEFEDQSKEPYVYQVRYNEEEGTEFVNHRGKWEWDTEAEAREVLEMYSLPDDAHITKTPKIEEEDWEDKYPSFPYPATIIIK